MRPSSWWWAGRLAARPDLGADDVAQLAARARQDAGGLNMSSGGNGSTSHLAGEVGRLV
ncbi:hypothetical protein [Bordetella sp. BOR01]|uniref:hypothetical protein n=1 Tax=Bordetella sp. BOR01 TaxID=2854779 RepID=UPI001C468CFB|nr:hypothetical protein [Bordetella sp. BOR01]MBV7482034.1 hypothetical protein [Bordetella sp. BOR01]